MGDVFQKFITTNRILLVDFLSAHEDLTSHPSRVPSRNDQAHVGQRDPCIHAGCQSWRAATELEKAALVNEPI